MTAQGARHAAFRVALVTGLGKDRVLPVCHAEGHYGVLVIYPSGAACLLQHSPEVDTCLRLIG